MKHLSPSDFVLQIFFLRLVTKCPVDLNFIKNKYLFFLSCIPMAQPYAPPTGAVRYDDDDTFL